MNVPKFSPRSMPRKVEMAISATEDGASAEQPGKAQEHVDTDGSSSGLRHEQEAASLERANATISLLTFKGTPSTRLSCYSREIKSKP